MMRREASLLMRYVGRPPFLVLLARCVPRFPYLEMLRCSRYKTAGSEVFVPGESSNSCVLLIRVGKEPWRTWSSPVVVERSPQAVTVHIVAMGWRGADWACTRVEAIRSAPACIENRVTLNELRIPDIALAQSFDAKILVPWIEAATPRVSVNIEVVSRVALPPFVMEPK